MKRHLSLLALLFGASLSAFSSVLPAEALLPGDTIVVLTVPDFNRAREIYARSPQGQFWRDPAMKSFKDKFVTQFKSKFITPLERELGAKLTDYTDLAQGQLTVALVGNQWGTDSTAEPATLFLLDTRDKSEQLTQRLAEIKQKWTDSGKDFKTERIRDIEFSVLIAASGDIFGALSRVTGTGDGEMDDGDAEDGDEEKQPAEIYIGQAESLFIMASEASVIEKVLIRMSGGLVPSLREQPSFEANYNAMFRDAPVYGWADTGRIIETLQRRAAEEADSGQPSLMNLSPDKILEATGVAGLRTVAFKYDYRPDGGMFHLLLGAPESRRSGLFKIFAAEPKDARPPAFVPADVVKFQRSRLDGQKAWATIESMLTAISPQMMGGFNFMLETAEAMVKQTDPSFDLRRNLIGNLGDDYIVYQKLPREKTLAELNAPPTLYLIGSPNAEQFAGALKSVFLLIGGALPEEREFLGRKIFTVKLPTPPTGASGAAAKPRTLSYAASGGYVGLSSDVALLEEYLRSGDSNAKPLRETVGLTEAAQEVGGMATGFFGYADQRESMRVTFEALKKDAGSGESMINFMIQSNLIMGTGDTIQDWADFKLLPDYAQVAKYFGFTVYSWNATSDGLHMKMFAPTPAGMKQ